MATLARADISAAMSLILMDRMVDQFRRDVPLVHLLTVRRNGRNDALTWNPKFDGRTAGGAYAEGADMTDADFDSHDRAKASLPWAAYRAGAKVSGLAMSVSDRGYAGALPDMGDDLFDEELTDGLDKMASDVGADLYGGNPGAAPPELAGASLAVDSAAGVFAGLDSATYPQWLGNESTLAAGAMSFSTLRERLIRPVKDATGRKPDFITCPGDIFDDIKDLFEEGADVVQQVRINGVIVEIWKAAGAEAVIIDGVPFIEDRFCPAGTLHSWTASQVEIVQLPSKKPRRDPNRVVAAIKALTGVDVEVADIEARMRRSGVIVPTIEWLAQTGDSYKAMIKAYLQVKWKTRHGHAKLVLI